VYTWDVARQDWGPSWSVAQWALYWRVTKGFAGKPTVQDAAVGAPPPPAGFGGGSGGGGSSDGGGEEEVDSHFVKSG
jgi:hypothetical protein